MINKKENSEQFTKKKDTFLSGDLQTQSTLAEGHACGLFKCFYITCISKGEQMTKDDFQKCAGNSGKSDAAGDAARGVQVVSLSPQLQGPRPPAPRSPMPQAPYGARIMPVAASIKVLPASLHAVKGSKHIKTESATDGE